MYFQDVIDEFGDYCRGCEELSFALTKCLIFLLTWGSKHESKRAFESFETSWRRVQMRPIELFDKVQSELECKQVYATHVSHPFFQVLVLKIEFR